MTNNGGSLPDASRTLGKTTIALVVTLVIMAGLLFWPAGTFDWPLGWWFLAIFTVLVVAASAYMWRINPELFEAREGFKPGTKTRDAIVASILLVCIAAILPVAGFDKRFGWMPDPAWLVVTGYVIFAIGFALALWAEAVNRFFEMGVRIQTDRGHSVIDTGPYSRIRHPGYSGAIILCIGTALALGSLVALIPVAVVVAVLVLRTLLEEQTLSNELPGYASYMERVRYRWVPGVW